MINQFLYELPIFVASMISLLLFAAITLIRKIDREKEPEKEARYIIGAVLLTVILLITIIPVFIM